MLIDIDVRILFESNIDTILKRFLFSLWWILCEISKQQYNSMSHLNSKHYCIAEIKLSYMEFLLEKENCLYCVSKAVQTILFITIQTKKMLTKIQKKKRHTLWVHHKEIRVNIHVNNLITNYYYLTTHQSLPSIVCRAIH